MWPISGKSPRRPRRGERTPISLINTLVGLAIDVRTRTPILGNITGGLSGPAIKPVGLAMVWKVAQAVKVPIVGLGGIATAEDALEYLIAGATAVQVGCAHFFRSPGAPENHRRHFQSISRSHDLNGISSLIGSLKTK